MRRLGTATTALIGAALFLSACTANDPALLTLNNQDRQMSSAEVSSALADKSFRIEWQDGGKDVARFAPALDSLTVASGERIALRLMENGILCADMNQRRFCYRFSPRDNGYVGYTADRRTHLRLTPA